MKKTSLLLLCIIFSLTSYAQHKDPVAVNAIKKIRALTNNAIQEFDMITETRYYTDDYVITTGEGRHIGSVSEYIEAYKNDTTSLYVRTTDDVQISSDGSLAFETGHWIEKEKGISYYNGRYTAQWKKIKGVLKVRSEIYVTLWIHPSRRK